LAEHAPDDARRQIADRVVKHLEASGFELDLCDSERGAWLVMAMRHLGRGRVVYQPAIFQGVVPPDERSAAALFALAAKSPEPIPVIAQMDVLRLRRGLR
jgi:hypothetical protein